MDRGPLGLFRTDDTRSTAHRLRRIGLQARSLAGLPRPVARFWLKALQAARRDQDTWSIDVACRPNELRVLLDVMGDADRVAEIGTAAAWTTSCLALARPGREVHTWDIIAQPPRDKYLALLKPEDRARIHLYDRPGGTGPEDPPVVDAVFIDSSHEKEETIHTFRVWEPVLPVGGVVAFHDWEDDAYPGVTEAIREMGLQGRVHGHLFVWTKPAQPAAAASA